MKMEVEVLYFGKTRERVSKTSDKVKAYKKVYQIKEEWDIVQSFTEEIKKIWEEYREKGLFSIRFYIPQNSSLKFVD